MIKKFTTNLRFVLSKKKAGVILLGLFIGLVTGFVGKFYGPKSKFHHFCTTNIR